MQEVEFTDLEVMCCFCGNSLSLTEAVKLVIYPPNVTDESQQLFAHKEHFVEKLHNSIPLHPDFIED